MSEELCPFCGSEPGDPKRYGRAFCSNEDCDMHTSTVSWETWNTRSNPAASPGVVGEDACKACEERAVRTPDKLEEALGFALGTLGYIKTQALANHPGFNKVAEMNADNAIKKIQRALAQRSAGNKGELTEALENLLNRYTGLVNCGDCGFWDPETEEDVINARKALTSARQLLGGE